MCFFWITDRDSFWTGKYGMRVTVKKNSEPFFPEQRQIRDFFQTKVGRVRQQRAPPTSSATSN